MQVSDSSALCLFNRAYHSVYYDHYFHNITSYSCRVSLCKAVVKQLQCTPLPTTECKTKMCYEEVFV